MNSRILNNKFIKRIGSYLQLDVEYFIKNYIYLALAQGIVALLGLLLSVAFARLVSKELFGQWNYILSMFGLFTIFCLPGINEAIIRAVARGYDKTLVIGTKEKFKWSILGSLALLALGIYYFLDGSEVLGKCFIISSFVFPFYKNLGTYISFLTGKKSFNQVAKYRIITETLSILATLMALYFTGNLIIIVIVSLVAHSLLHGYFFRLTSKKIVNESHDVQAISFGKHLTLLNTFQMISAADSIKIIVGIMLSFSELAIYSVARGFQEIILSFMGFTATLSYPKLSEMNQEEAYAAVKKRLPHLIVITIITCGILIALCPYVIPLFYTEKYVDSVLYAQILLGALIFGIPAAIYNRALFPAQREIKKLYKVRSILPLVRLVLVIALTLTYGLLGVVLAQLISSIIGLVFSMKLARWF